MNISEFLNNEYSDFALYSNYRAHPSYIDGLKNSGRKLVYTIRKKNIKSTLKVTALTSEVVKAAGYLHGDASMCGTIVTRAQSYSGANNLPILTGEGSFGTRFIPEASAPRYIFARPADYFDQLFVKADDQNLISQEFENAEIEPVFYVPVIPLLLVNGSTGIGKGFADDIAARDVNNMIAAIKAKLDGKKLKKEWFTPVWHGFRGTVKEIEPNTWEVKGLAEINGKKVIIDELPMVDSLGNFYTLEKYRSLLKKLRDKDIIDKFIDYSDDDKFKFEVTLSADEAAKSKEKIFSDLGLVGKFTENLVCIGENNDIKDDFKSAEDIFNAYYAIKITYLKKRLKSETARLEKETRDLEETVRFINEVIKDTINMKAKKADIEALMKKKKYVNIDKLISMPLYSITEDKAKELKKKWDEKIKELEAYKLETPESIWKKDLAALEKVIKN